jgi:hypothetical protein
MVVMSSGRVLNVCRQVEYIRVAYVLLKPSHNSAIAMSNVNRMR